MSNKIHTGAVDDDFDVAGNWDPSGIPADGDVLYFTAASLNPLVSNLVQAAKNFDVIITRGFIQYIGGSGNPFQPDDIGTLVYSGLGTTPTFIECASGKKITRVLLDTQVTQENILHLAGVITRGTVRNGSLAIDTGATIEKGIKVAAAQGSGLAKCVIPSGVTLTGSVLKVNGGLLDCSSDLIDVIVDRGDFILNGTASVSGRVEVNDNGVFTWDASISSTIALAEVFGGALRTRNEKLGRTLTEGIQYGNGLYDFETGGLLMALTVPIRVFGETRPKFPKGAAHSVSV